MITVDTCGTTAYSPLIPAIKAICEAPFGETLEIIMNHADAFQDLKVQSPNQKIPDRKTKCVIKTHINIKQNVIFGAKLKPV